MRREKRKRQVTALSEKKKNARGARSVHAGRKRRSRSERRKKGRTENERSERSDKKEIGRRRNVRTEEIATEKSTISTRRGDIKMMMVTEERRGTIASEIAIAIALLAIGPLIAIAKAVMVSQIMMDGPECRTGEKRARVSRINSLNLIIFRLQCS